MSAAINPVAHYIVEAQRIVLEAQGMRSDPREAVRQLAALLCSIEANQAFLDAGVFALQQTAAGGPR